MEADASPRMVPGAEASTADDSRLSHAEPPGLASISHAVGALYRLLIADLKLSAGGLSRALVCAALALLSLAFVGLFGSTLLVLSLHAAGWSWLGALVLTTTLSGLAAVAFWLASRRALRLTGLHASQRQINAMLSAMTGE